MTLARLIPLPLLALLVAIPPVFAQTAPIPITPESALTPTLKVASNLVAVSAIVRDQSGQPIPNLTRDNFILKQDGKPQPIAYFSQGSGLPLTLALMVDTSGSQRSYIQDEIAAGRAFFPAMLTQPEDRAVLVQFDSTILQLAKITSSVTTLEHALAYLSQSHSDYTAPGHGGGTLLFDAICAVSHLELGSQIGRRAMVILTDGGDNGSHFSQKQAIEEAQRADTMVYTIDYSNGGGDEDALKDLSKATGGREFSVNSKMTLQQIYTAIASDLRQQYEIGYRPPDSRPNRYHKIDLRAKDKKLTVQARAGYFTPKQPSPHLPAAPISQITTFKRFAFSVLRVTHLVSGFCQREEDLARSRCASPGRSRAEGVRPSESLWLS
jgi:Ca-activated chloride channel homolog